MINVSTITKQLHDWLVDDPELDGVLVSRSEIVNENADLAVNGWIGIYRRTVNYDPRNLGVPPNNYEADISIMLMVQKSVLQSGASCEDALEDLIKKVLDRVVQIPRTYLDTFLDIGVEYTYIESDRKTMHFQGALITFEAEVQSEVK